MFLGSCGAATCKSAVIKRGLKKNERLAKANTRSGGEAGELPSAGTTFPCQGKPCTWRQGAKAAMEDSEIHAVGRTCNLAHVKGNWLHLRSVKVCHHWKMTPKREKGRLMGALTKEPSSCGGKTIQERSLIWWLLRNSLHPRGPATSYCPSAEPGGQRQQCATSTARLLLAPGAALQGCTALSRAWAWMEEGF